MLPACYTEVIFISLSHKLPLSQRHVDCSGSLLLTQNINVWLPIGIYDGYIFDTWKLLLVMDDIAMLICVLAASILSVTNVYIAVWNFKFCTVKFHNLVQHLVLFAFCLG
jgi:hypothetical protein